MSSSLWPMDCSMPGSSVHYSQVCSDWCPLSRWCYLIISSSAISFFCHQSFLASGSFSNEVALPIRWPKYWSFSFCPSNEYWGLISFRIDWFDPHSPRDSQESSPAPQFKSISSSAFSLPYGPLLTSVHDYWKNHSVQFCGSLVSNSLQPHGLQYFTPPCPSPTPGVYSNSCLLIRWCHPTISSSVIPFSSHLQSFPTSGFFQWVSSLHQVARVLEFQFQHLSFHWIFKTDFL